MENVVNQGVPQQGEPMDVNQQYEMLIQSLVEQGMTEEEAMQEADRLIQEQVNNTDVTGTSGISPKVYNTYGRA